MTKRISRITRETKETHVQVDLGLDEDGPVRVETGLGFLDHMLATLGFHAGWRLELSCEGDLRVDDHHTVEDCALALGQAVDEALADRAGIARFGFAYAPLDEALSRSVIDLSGRPCAAIDLGLRRDRIGDVATENLTHWFGSFAVSLRAGLHVDVLRGDNDHHRVEAGFKATALALRSATATAGCPERVPSTKGALS